MSDVASPRSGWYLDPENQELQRYWDGAAWTTRTAPAPGITPVTAAEHQAAGSATSSMTTEAVAPAAATAATAATAPSEPPAPAQASSDLFPTSEQRAPAPERPSRRIGRGTIVLIFVGAIVIAIGGSMLLTGGLPS
ncbi:DUF2510 domain-containing protein [Demequina oxidasica]|uniref:DUF2510 domain-containing protein n=1 Tax=Demequina oxidasica TaxID=676199 RepID=UPI000782C4DE|nr:DUF2510 domain-containing protein [Demequina oxidasica]